MEPTEQSNDKLAISLHSTPLFRWIAEQVTILAEAFGEPLTPARLKIYAESLADLDQAQLASAFRRAIRELKFFPKVAELIALSGADEQTRTQIEAESAWQLAERDLAGRGRDARPGLDDRTEYAIRAAGGRRAIDSCFSASLTTEQFTKKAFVEAFANYDAAQQFGLAQLPAAVTAKLSEITSGAREALPAVPETEADTPIASAIKTIPQPLTDSDLKARRALLARQVESLSQ